MTGPEKTGLIYTKYTYLYYGAYLFFRVCYPNSVSCIEFLRILCIYDEDCVRMLCSQDEILHFKDQNLGQILRVDKTCFLRHFTSCFLHVHLILLQSVWQLHLTIFRTPEFILSRWQISEYWNLFSFALFPSPFQWLQFSTTTFPLLYLEVYTEATL